MPQEAFKEEALNLQREALLVIAKTSPVVEWRALLVKCTSGIHASEGEKCHVRARQDLADLQPAEMMKILKELATQSMQMVVGPLMRFLR
jgi:hypothetical protein